VYRSVVQPAKRNHVPPAPVIAKPLGIPMPGPVIQRQPRPGPADAAWPSDGDIPATKIPCIATDIPQISNTMKHLWPKLNKIGLRRGGGTCRDQVERCQVHAPRI